MTLSTHVLDTALGVPGAGIDVVLLDPDGELVAEATTDVDGRAVLLEGEVPAGTHRLAFDVAAYDALHGRAGFFPEVAIAVDLPAPVERLHVPLLLSPYGYTTYRGS